MILTLDRACYSQESLVAGSAAVDAEAEVYVSATRALWEIELRPKAKADAKTLRRLAGLFLDEALSHQYRQKVVRFNRLFAQAALGAALSKGFEPAPEDPLEQLEPQVKADRAQELAGLLEAARRL